MNTEIQGNAPHTLPTFYTFDSSSHLQFCVLFVNILLINNIVNLSLCLCPDFTPKSYQVCVVWANRIYLGNKSMTTKDQPALIILMMAVCYRHVTFTHYPLWSVCHNVRLADECSPVWWHQRARERLCLDSFVQYKNEINVKHDWFLIELLEASVLAQFYTHTLSLPVTCFPCKLHVP